MPFNTIPVILTSSSSPSSSANRAANTSSLLGPSDSSNDAMVALSLHGEEGREEAGREGEGREEKQREKDRRKGLVR